MKKWTKSRKKAASVAALKRAKRHREIYWAKCSLDLMGSNIVGMMAADLMAGYSHPESN